ncbi:MAG TPA: hypothetical protein VF622_19695 [Segetibacter sp.]|jgi:hypothetical protein
MKKIINSTLVALAVIICSQSIAQVTTAGRPSLSLGAEVGIPAGDFNKTAKLGLGGSLKALFPIFEGGALTLSGGYISFSGDQIGNTNLKHAATNLLPFKAGLRYNLSPGGVYLEPQLGYTSISYKGGASGTGGFTYAANLGVLMQAIDLSIRYEGLSRENLRLPYLGLRGAYNFRL